MKIYYAEVRELNNEKMSAYFGGLSEYRKEKISKLKYEKDKKLSLAAGILLSRALEDYDISEKNCKYIIGEHGKPALLDYSDINFSISHSGDLAVLIIGRDINCGIDAEQIKHFPSKEKIAKRFFNQKDFDVLNSLDERSADRYFAKVWTRAESYAKMTGKGLDFSDEVQSKVTDDAFMNERSIYFEEFNLELNMSYLICVCSNCIDIKNIECVSL